jgi:hypothetical protein
MGEEPTRGKGVSEQMTTVRDVVASKHRPTAASPPPAAKVDGSFPQLVWTHYRW